MIDAQRPQYSYSIRRLFMPLVRILSGMRSTLSHDAALLLQGANPPPIALNAQNIPADSPFFLVFNHYDGPELGAWWGISIMATTIAAQRTREPRQVHFMMAREWWYPSGFDRWFKQPFTAWLFGRVANAYGLIRLPPALRMDLFRGEGMVPIRHALHLSRGEHPELIGVAPEGITGPDFTLCKPKFGTGLMLLLLTYDTIPCLPVGIFEDEQKRLKVNFGKPFQLHVPRQLPREDRDLQAATQVMTQIGKLLPPRMWGEYREDIEKD